MQEISYLQNTPEYAVWRTLIMEHAEQMHVPWRESFHAFIEDVGKCKIYGRSLERLDKERNFEPGNVRWQQKEQGYVPTNQPPHRVRKKRALVSEIPLPVLAAAVAEVRNKSHLELKLYGASKAGRTNALQERVEAEGIDIKHWTGRHVKKPWISAIKPKKTPFENLTQQGLRLRVLREKLLEYKCASCGCQSEWNGIPLTLHLDHVDGNRKNHLFSNLRFLCPNCHQQTKTWGNKRSRILPEDDQVLLGLAETLTQTEIAAMYGVHSSSISHRLRKYYG